MWYEQTVLLVLESLGRRNSVRTIREQGEGKATEKKEALSKGARGGGDDALQSKRHPAERGTGKISLRASGGGTKDLTGVYSMEGPRRESDQKTDRTKAGRGRGGLRRSGFEYLGFESEKGDGSHFHPLGRFRPAWVPQYLSVDKRRLNSFPWPKGGVVNCYVRGGDPDTVFLLVFSKGVERRRGEGKAVSSYSLWERLDNERGGNPRIRDGDGGKENFNARPHDRFTNRLFYYA